MAVVDYTVTGQNFRKDRIPRLYVVANVYQKANADVLTFY
jgi:hypothetical protein